jgi:hypothetical protein
LAGFFSEIAVNRFPLISVEFSGKELQLTYLMMQRAVRVYSLATRQKSVKLYRDLKENGSCVINGEEIFTCTELVKRLNLKNESTLRSWANKSWDKTSAKARLAKRGKKAKLTTEQKDELCS